MAWKEMSVEEIAEILEDLLDTHELQKAMSEDEMKRPLEKIARELGLH